MRYWIVGLFGTFVLLIWSTGVVTIDVTLAWSIYKQQQEKSWPIASGIVTRSDMTKPRGARGGTTYRAAIEYDYTVAGRVHHSDRQAFGMFFTSSSQQVAEDALAKFPVGTSVQARYNPVNPSEATLSVGVEQELLWVALFITAFNCAMVGLWCYGVGLVWRALTKPICGGLRLIESDGMTLIRVAWVSPFFVGLFSTGILGSASAAVMSVFSMTSFTTMGIAFGVTYGLGIGIGLFVYLFGARWDKFILIDERASTITVPPLRRPSAQHTMRLSEIREVSERTEGRGKNAIAYLRIVWETSRGTQEQEWQVSLRSDRLPGLVAYLRDRFGLAKPQ